MCRTSVVNSDMYAKSLLSRGPRITYLRNREGRRLVVRVKREGAASRKYRMWRMARHIAKIWRSKALHFCSAGRILRLMNTNGFHEPRSYLWTAPIAVPQCVNCQCGGLLGEWVHEHRCPCYIFFGGVERVLEVARPLQVAMITSQCSEDVAHDAGFSTKRWQKFTIRANCCSPFTVVGLSNFRIGSTLAGNGIACSSSMWWLR